MQSRWAARNEASHVGNIGWLFGNWGKRPVNPKMRAHLDEVLKKQPAMVIGLAECQLDTEEVLQREPAAVAANAPSGARRRFKDRPEFSYLTLRGDEEKSVLIAVRDQAGCALDLLDVEKLCHGQTRKRGSTARALAYSRSIIAKVTLPHNVGFLGKTHVAMVVHMHNAFANGSFAKTELHSFLSWLWEKTQQAGCRS